MVFKRDEKLNVPGKDLISWYFDNPKVDDDKPVYIDAQNPNRSYTFGQARSTVKKLAAGFRKAGLKKGDVVCLHSFNDVSGRFASRSKVLLTPHIRSTIQSSSTASLHSAASSLARTPPTNRTSSPTQSKPRASSFSSLSLKS